MKDGLKNIWKKAAVVLLGLCHESFLEGLREATKISIKIVGEHGRDPNWEPHECEIE